MCGKKGKRTLKYKNVHIIIKKCMYVHSSGLYTSAIGRRKSVSRPFPCTWVCRRGKNSCVPPLIKVFVCFRVWNKREIIFVHLKQPQLNREVQSRADRNAEAA